MFIRLSLMPDSREIWIRAIDVRSVEKAPPGQRGEIQLGSVVATNLMTPSGPFGYHVAESAKEIAETITQVLGDKTGALLGEPTKASLIAS